MKTSAIIRIVIWSVVACLLVVLLCMGINGKWNHFSLSIGSSFRYPNADRYKSGNGQTDASGMHTVDIHWVSGQVQIVPTDETVIRWEETTAETLSEKKRLHYLVENGVLHLQFRQSAFTLFDRIPSKELTVYLPASLLLNQLEIENVSGGIRLTNLSAANASLETVSGGIQVNGLNSDSLDMTTVSGQIQVDQIDVVNISAESVSGDVQVRGKVQRWDWETVSGDSTFTSSICPDKIDCESVSGDFTVSIPDNNGFTVELDTVSKNFQCDFPLTSLKEDVRQYKTGGGDFSFDSVSGDIHIMKQ